MASLVVYFFHMVGSRQQTHLQHHLQKSQLSLPWTQGSFASQTWTPSGPWLCLVTSPLTLVATWQCPYLACLTYFRGSSLGVHGKILKLSPPHRDHGKLGGCGGGEVGPVSGPWSHPLVTTSSLPYYPTLYIYTLPYGPEAGNLPLSQMENRAHIVLLWDSPKLK